MCLNQLRFKPYRVSAFRDVFRTALRAGLLAFGWLLAGAWINAHAQSATDQSVTSTDAIGQFLRDRGISGPIEQRAAQLSNLPSRLVVHAMGFIGVPYKLGGNSVEQGGLDCSGFVKAVFQQMTGKVLPRKAEQQAAATTEIEKAELQPGDLVFFNTLKRSFSHVGIYVGDGRFVHSPRPGGEVRVESMHKSYWAGRYDGARRALSPEL